MKNFILQKLSELQNGYSLCGIIDRRARVYPLGSDSKLISILFEIVARQVVWAYAKQMGMLLIEPMKQNHYPDFTLMLDEEDHNKVAVDVKTTYLRERQSRFGFTLGSYTSYIRPQTEAKNIVYPYSNYAEHWIIGFVYHRTEDKWHSSRRMYTLESLQEIPIPFGHVEVFMQEKWRIAGDQAGSGNTANIGSIRGTIDDFKNGNGIFASNSEFLDYWRGYKRTKLERQQTYSNIHEFRARREP